MYCKHMIEYAFRGLIAFYRQVLERVKFGRDEGKVDPVSPGGLQIQSEFGIGSGAKTSTSRWQMP